MQYGPATYRIVYPAPVIVVAARRTMVCEIQARVARYFELTVADMRSARRTRDVARPRQIAMWLARHYTRNSLPEIGRRFGNRDHTTVIHAIRQIDKLREIDPEVAADVRELSRGFIGKAGWA